MSDGYRRALPSSLTLPSQVPDMVLLLSYWYKARELNVRLAWFWCARPLCPCQSRAHQFLDRVSLTVTTIIGSFMAAGILKMRGVNGVEGWRYLFLCVSPLSHRRRRAPKLTCLDFAASRVMQQSRRIRCLDADPLLFDRSDHLGSRCRRRLLPSSLASPDRQLLPREEWLV